MAYKTQDVLNSKQSKNEFDTIIQQLGKYSKYTIPQNRMNALLNNIRVKSNTKKGLSLLKKAFKMKLTKQQKSQLVEYAVKLGNIATDYDTERALYNLAIENYSPAKSIAPKSAIIKLYISSYISQADNEKNNKEKIKLYETARKEARRYNNKSSYITATGRIAETCALIAVSELSTEYGKKAVEYWMEIKDYSAIYNYIMGKNKYKGAPVNFTSDVYVKVGRMAVDWLSQRYSKTQLIQANAPIELLMSCEHRSGSVIVSKDKELSKKFAFFWDLLDKKHKPELKKMFEEYSEKYNDKTVYTYLIKPNENKPKQKKETDYTVNSRIRSILDSGSPSILSYVTGKWYTVDWDFKGTDGYLYYKRKMNNPKISANEKAFYKDMMDALLLMEAVFKNSAYGNSENDKPIRNSALNKFKDMVKSLEKCNDVKTGNKILSDFKNDSDVKYMIKNYKVEITQR